MLYCLYVARFDFLIQGDAQKLSISKGRKVFKNESTASTSVELETDQSTSMGSRRVKILFHASIRARRMAGHGMWFVYFKTMDLFVSGSLEK